MSRSFEVWFMKNTTISISPEALAVFKERKRKWQVRHKRDTSDREYFELVLKMAEKKEG